MNKKSYKFSFIRSVRTAKKKLQMTTEALATNYYDKPEPRLIPEFPKLQFSQEKQLSSEKYLA